MLINDPTRQKRADENGRNGVGHAPVRRQDGKVYLPAQSVRGALRAQARRIWQTLAGETGNQNLNGTIRDIANRRGEQSKLARFLAMFGTTGWRSPIAVEDFLLVQGQAEKSHPQHFVAVDRFTGGAANEKKFKAEGLLHPTFAGTIAINLARWESAGVDVWAWLLLAYLLRDWSEGDGTLGLGAAKGYGAFHASVRVERGSEEAELLEGVLERRAEALADHRVTEWQQSLEQALVAQ